MPLANINGNKINYKDTGGDKPAMSKTQNRVSILITL